MFAWQKKHTYQHQLREFKTMQDYEIIFEDLVSQLQEAGFEINENALYVCNIRATQIAWSQYREISNQVYQGA